MEKLFDRHRFPYGLWLIPFVIYLPIGILFGFLRFFIGLQALLVSAVLQKVSSIRTLILRGICCTLGLLVIEKNAWKRDEEVPLIVSNHISIIDHIALHLVTGSSSFCSQKAPVLVQQAFRYQSLDKGRILAPGDIVDMQPEGAITNGRSGLLKFKTVPIYLSDAVQPVTLRLWRPILFDVKPNVLGATWLGDLLWFLIVPVSVVTVKYLPPMRHEEGESDEDWTKRIQQRIADDLGQPITEYTAANRVELERALLPLEVQLRLLGPAHMAVRLKESFPSLPLAVIRAEIERTKSIGITVSNLMRLQSEKTNSIGEIRKSELDTAVAVFPKSAQDRMASFQERKARLIETARKRYVEKKALNSKSS